MDGMASYAAWMGAGRDPCAGQGQYLDRGARGPRTQFRLQGSGGCNFHGSEQVSRRDVAFKEGEARGGGAEAVRRRPREALSRDRAANPRNNAELPNAKK